MKTTSISSLLPYPKIHFTKRFNISGTAPFSRPVKFLTINCINSSQNGETTKNLKDALTGMVDEKVDELLNREENKVLLDGLEKATQRVEMAKKELAEIERQELEAKLLKDYITQLETRASESYWITTVGGGDWHPVELVEVLDALMNRVTGYLLLVGVIECQKDILEARAMIEEAERSLNVGGDARRRDATDGDEVTRDEERVESIKAASLSAIVGTLAGLPISLSRITSSSELILPLSITFISCALFGVTFRYAVRRDLDNFQLKSGTSAAFGVVKGLATLGGEPPLELDAASFWSHALDGAVYVSENLLIFLFAGVGLDLCFKLRILSPFPIDRSISETDKI
ncbi:putative oligopeptide transporter 7-like [Capsicum annuum]|nr:putative oligopeptide transporter 7-like [Capsicum annuum]